jgi:hypothetical protein
MRIHGIEEGKAGKGLHIRDMGRQAGVRDQDGRWNTSAGKLQDMGPGSDLAGFMPAPDHFPAEGRKLRGKEGRTQPDQKTVFRRERRGVLFYEHVFL